MLSELPSKGRYMNACLEEDSACWNFFLQDLQVELQEQA